MYKTIQVITIIAIVSCSVEICALLVSYIEAPKLIEEPYLSNMAERASIRWRIYWFVGAPIALIRLYIKKKFELMGYTLFIVGLYLMLYGNNGGFWSEGYIIPRLITTTVTLFSLLFLIRNEKWSKQNLK